MEGRWEKKAVQVYMKCETPTYDDRKKHDVHLGDKWICPCGCVWLFKTGKDGITYEYQAGSYDQCENSLCYYYNKWKIKQDLIEPHTTITCGKAMKMAKGAQWKERLFGTLFKRT